MITETNYGKFFCFEPDVIGRTIAQGKFWDIHLKPFIDALGPDSVMVDVGANIGFLAIYCALHRGARVHAFEPSYPVWDLLARNIALNGLTGSVHAYHIALYDKQTELVINPEWVDFVRDSKGLVDYEKSPNSGGLSLVPAKDSQQAYVVATTLDWYELERVDLLKIDTQGSDLRVLLGAKRTIERCKPTICFEFEHNGCGRNAAGDTFGNFEDFLHELGYNIRYIGGNGDTWRDYVAEQ